MFAVIIPFYQRERGILATTLASVAQQDIEMPVNVYVVDDESPVAPEAEVGAIDWPENFSVRILKKKNGGPGSARNLALDSLSTEKYVAFLDSDDRWQPHHLGSAEFAFRNGFDYYTAETMHESDGTRVHADIFGGALPLRRYGDVAWAYELTEPIINFTVAGPVSGSSTMVMTRTLIGETRFDCSLRTCGEDGLFTTSVAAKNPKVLISSRVDTVLGRGVNIFSAGDWGTRDNLMRSLYFLRSRLLMKSCVEGFDVAEKNLDAVLRQARRGFWAAALATVRRGAFPWGPFLRMLASDPRLMLHAPTALLRVLLRP